MVQQDHIVVDIPEQVSSDKAGVHPAGNPQALLVSESFHQSYDNEFFQGVVEDAGRWAYGVIFVEVWVMNVTRTHLFRPESGYWMDPCAHDYGENSNFVRLVDANVEGYLEPTPLAPGVGLPGVLYGEVHRGNLANQQQRTTEPTDSPTNDNTSRRGSMGGSTSRGIASNLLERGVSWREVRPLANDPDQPYNPRLQLLAESGLGWAAGVPFSIGSTEGIVIYMARENASFHKLSDPINEDYLTHATLLIGSAYTLRIPRLAAENVRRNETKRNIRRVRDKILAFVRMNVPLDKVVLEESQHSLSQSLGGKTPTTPPRNESEGVVDQIVDGLHSVWDRLRLSATKFWGAGVQPPPTFTWVQTAWTFVGAFITLLIITKMNDRLRENGPEYAIVLGPFGALMTLQYGLTAAPASQPRNAILGQTIGLVIAHSIGQIEDMEPWFKMSLATSIAIAVMVKCGVTHPPAGAAALLFSTGVRDWKNVGMMLLGNVVAIVCATFFNNLSDRRQYPTYWGLEPIYAKVMPNKKEE